MYPYLRSARILLAARLGSRLDFEGESVLDLRVGLGDIDVFWELNNGRHLTLMDLGRFDLAVRSGFVGVVHREGWGLTVGGASVRFRHRVPPLSRIRLRSRVVGRDDRWFYFHQRIERGGRVCSAALVRTAVVSNGSVVPVERVLEAMGRPGWAPELPGWVRAWIEAEGLRPWPVVGPSMEGKEELAP
jgi:acyl-CoA thioesterase FadM